MKRTIVLAVALAVTAVAVVAAPVVKLVYWSMWNQTEPQAQVLAAAIEDFEAKNPGVKVEVNWNGREIRKTLQPALDNKQVIDMWDEDTERVVKTWGAYALKLDSYVTKRYPTTSGKAYKDSVMASLLDLSRSYAKDKGLYAIPYQPFVFAFMYNKEHFAKAGIASTPKTWDDLLADMAKLKASGFTPMTVDDAYMDCLPGYYLAREKGYQWVQQLVKDKTNAMWSDPAVLQMAKAYENLVKLGYVSNTAASNKWPAGQQDVAAGTVTMYLNGTWLVNEIMGSTGPDFKWGTFSFPTVPGGKDDATAANYGAQAFEISKNCKNPELAFALIVHLTTGKWDAELAKKSYGVPVGGTTDWPVQLTEAKSIFKGLKTCYPWAAGIEADTDKAPVITENFAKLIGGTITADQFVEAMKK
jgi:raffinose/stachyose/melibiose transport system substrate-binding protein